MIVSIKVNQSLIFIGINKNEVDVTEYNFDHPLALDFDLAYDVLQKLKYSN